MGIIFGLAFVGVLFVLVCLAIESSCMAVGDHWHDHDDDWLKYQQQVLDDRIEKRKNKQKETP